MGKTGGLERKQKLPSLMLQTTNRKLERAFQTRGACHLELVNCSCARPLRFRSTAQLQPVPFRHEGGLRGAFQSGHRIHACQCQKAENTHARMRPRHAHLTARRPNSNPPREYALALKGCAKWKLDNTGADRYQRNEH